MKVAELLDKRRDNWAALELFCDRMQSKKSSPLRAGELSRFAALYRAAIADLALSSSYQLPPTTVAYLHRLVGRAHNQLHRSLAFRFQVWVYTLLLETPQKIFGDRCVQFAFCMFWFLFLLAAYLAYHDDLWPGFAAEVIGEQQMEQMESSFVDFDDRPWEVNFQMAQVYIVHNTGIGLKCFVNSLLVIPGLIALTYNAVNLGAVFGYMFRPELGDAGANFKNFVTAHGPFELTAIVLSCGAGLRIGMSWLVTGGLSRFASLRINGRDAMPMMGAAIILFFLAALIEGFISPTSLPWGIKAFVALFSSGMLMFYFVVLGFPRDSWRATQ